MEIIKKFWEANKSKIWEAFKAFLRGLVFLVLAWAVSYVRHDLPQTQTTAIIFSILTFTDKWLHENWRETKTGIKGITPF